ncbi:MAG: 5-formyltetrahydrofolate cyclo-ligase [Spongiibacteraceae bacterium]
MSSVSQTDDTRSQKRELRRALRARRRALPRWRQRSAARRMARLMSRQHWYQRARSLAVYLANDAEIDPSLFIFKAFAEGKRLLLPRLRGKQLEFVHYRPRDSSLRRNRFNIPEPVGRAVPLRNIDVICMPLVGFDRQGRRLGMGGGFYDRTLAVERSGVKRRPRLIGLAYACQEVAQLPHEQWDVRMSGVVTESEWIRTRR